MGLRLPVGRRRSMWSRPSVLASVRQRRATHKNTQAGSPRCPSSNTRSGLDIPHRFLFRSFFPVCVNFIQSIR